jgi:NAD(P)H-dependent FMN reductase
VARLILGIVGSPRRGRLTDQLVTRCLEGAKETGVQTEKVYLVDYNVPFYTEEVGCPDKLNSSWEAADAYVVGAPVYWGSINGLTKNYMDIVKICDVKGKYGLGIAVAGGTGRGLCSGIQTLYRFFYHRQIRGVDPMPVSRFNFENALETLRLSGRSLAELSKERKRFEGDRDRMEHYEKLPYLNYTFLDEILLLAGQLVEISRGKSAFLEARKEYYVARSLVKQGKRTEAVEHAVRAYNLLYFDAPKA